MIKKNIKKNVLFLLLIGQYSLTYAQSMSENSNNENYKRPMYIGLGVGLNSSKFRDQATSPLFYEGTIPQVSFSLLKKDEKRESEFNFLYDFGSYNSSIGDDNYSSSINRFEISYSKLFQLNSLSKNGFNTKVGFMANSTANIRSNPSFFNNALGYEVFINALISAKVTKDISSKYKGERKFLFIKYQAKEQKRDLAFRLNLGLMNNTIRNGYIYYPLFGATVNDIKLFDGYEFKFFSGFRMSTRFDYTWYQKNKNALQFSYLWDAYKTGSDYEVFGMSHHVLRFTLYFNTNNH